MKVLHALYSEGYEQNTLSVDLPNGLTMLVTIPKTTGGGMVFDAAATTFDET